jgi:hypothetical protein
VGDYQQTADSRSYSTQFRRMSEVRARRKAVAPDFLCGREIGGGASRRPPLSIFLRHCVL